LPASRIAANPAPRRDAPPRQRITLPISALRRAPGPMGSPLSWNNAFETCLSIPTAEPRTPAPTQGRLARSRRPWMRPSSPPPAMDDREDHVERDRLRASAGCKHHQAAETRIDEHASGRIGGLDAFSPRRPARARTPQVGATARHRRCPAR
jgi:hypothetical protein